MSRPYSKGCVGGRHHRGGGGGGPTYGHANVNNRGGRTFGGQGRGAGNGSNNHANKPSGPNPSMDIMKTLLGLLFEKSYKDIFVEESGLLILSNMRASPDLVSAQKSVDFNSVSFCRALAEVVRDKFSGRIRSLMLDDNKIRKLSVFFSALEAVDVHLSISAISAKDNEVSDLSFLGSLKHYDNLSELLLTGNPVNSHRNYISQITQQLRHLRMIDGQLIEHTMLGMPNPIPSTYLDETKLTVLHHLEQTLFHYMATRNMDPVLNLYAPQSCYSIGKSNDPIPQRIPLDATHNTSNLDRPIRGKMFSDFSSMRSSVQWRNLVKDIQSMRSVAKGRAEVATKIKDLCGGNRLYFNVAQQFDPNVSVVFMEVGMKVPTCVLTVHGRLKYEWNPIHYDTKAPIFPPSATPFVACFFDRTLSLTWDAATSSWQIFNDIVFLRPDPTVTHEDGTPSSPLFFATAPSRVEALRRRLMPSASLDLMTKIVQRAVTDRQAQEMVAHLTSVPPEVLPQQLRELNLD